MTAGVKIHRYRGGALAECDDCNRLPAECTRERARQHVRSSGHVVRFIVADITVYQPEGTS